MAAGGIGTGIPGYLAFVTALVITVEQGTVRPVAGIVVLAVAVRSVALAGFGLYSLIETGASVAVIWELRTRGSR
jgi:hypothetical protein